MGFITADFVHPNIQGTYLATCVIYATILDKSPIGLPYVPSEQGGVTEEEAVFLQRIAWETVQDYKAQQQHVLTIPRISSASGKAASIKTNYEEA